MFNALNRFISRLDQDVPTPAIHHREYGFQVLRNTAQELAVEPWFDFIVGINGRMIDDPNCDLFIQEVRNCAGSTVSLCLWSAKGQKVRTLHIPVPVIDVSLGLTLQWNSINTVSNIWHILDVPANSPADVAGLLPYSDYIIGTPDGVLRGEIDLGELVEQYIGRSLRLYIYNNEFDVTRELTINPSRDWGGEGALGCVLGYGALHRLPAPLSEPVAGPGETLFETENIQTKPEGPSTAYIDHITSNFADSSEKNNFLVPSELVVPTTSIAPSVAKSTKKRDKRFTPNPKTNFLDEYFTEGEKKSREIDHAPSGKNIPPPPPPKIDTPSKASATHENDVIPAAEEDTQIRAE
ncbi:hypothetical protein K3495_g11232 [Podosphaera aphanis]|nr:hypothetical protein K3495_g11232 [Podosphaera aphanis]